MSNTVTAGGKRPNQTYKSLMVFYILLKMTDKDHPMETARIKEILSSFGIQAENLSIQRDIKNLRSLLDGEAFQEEELQDILFDILNSEYEYDEDLTTKLLELDYKITYDGSINNLSATRGFKVASRPYNTNDLWLLIEAVNGLKSVSEETSAHLKRLVMTLANIFEVQSLSIDTYVPEKHETSRDAVLVNLPKINEGIKKNKQISFDYYRYQFTSNRIEQLPSKARRTVSPIKLMYSNGLYYLMCYAAPDPKAAKPKELLYRVDKMRSITVCEDDRIDEVFTEEINHEAFSKRAFNMFQGKRTKVRICFADDLLDTIVERFGIDDNEVRYERYDDSHFTIYAPIEVSDQFFSWICGFRKRAKILTPAHVVKDFEEYLSDIQQEYSD